MYDVGVYEVVVRDACVCVCVCVCVCMRCLLCQMSFGCCPYSLMPSQSCLELCDRVRVNARVRAYRSVADAMRVHHETLVSSYYRMCSLTIECVLLRADRSVADAMSVHHETLADGRVQIKMYPQALQQGNYPVQLKIATGSSCFTTVEFILHLMKGSKVEAFMPSEDEDVYATKTSYVGFQSMMHWDADEEDSKLSYRIFDNLDEFSFGDAPPTSQIRGQDIASLSWVVQWTSSPCLKNLGMYFYCFYGLLANTPYEWQSIQCKVVRIVEDLPPTLSFYHRNVVLRPDYREHQTRLYSIYMGQRLEIVAEATDNPSDTIDFLSLSKVDINTGDRLRASIYMVATQVGDLHGVQSLWYKPQEVASVPVLEEIVLPPIVSLSVGGPTPTNTSLYPADESRNRVISYIPNRMHSGLEMSLCMMAGDSRGLCLPIGDATERCIRISVLRCQYAVNKGEDLVHVAGLFEVNWVQMWALNPTYTMPEVAAPDSSSIINIGQMYKVRKGEDVFDIARHFGMTIKQVMFFNADLSHQRTSHWAGHLSEGSELCIVPNSCFTHV